MISDDFFKTRSRKKFPMKAVSESTEIPLQKSTCRMRLPCLHFSAQNRLKCGTDACSFLLKSQRLKDGCCFAVPENVCSVVKQAFYAD